MVNSHRLLVRGHRIDYVAAVDEPQIAQQEAAFYYRIAFFVTAGLLVVCLILLIRSWRKVRRLAAQQDQPKAPDDVD